MLRLEVLLQSHSGQFTLSPRLAEVDRGLETGTLLFTERFRAWFQLSLASHAGRCVWNLLIRVDGDGMLLSSRLFRVDNNGIPFRSRYELIMVAIRLGVVRVALGFAIIQDLVRRDGPATPGSPGKSGKSATLSSSSYV